MKHQIGQYETARASKYLQQLCKHFAHKVEVTFDSNQGDVDFSFGPATLCADESALIVTLQGDSEAALKKGRMVIDTHLQRFAFREGFENMTWCAVS